MSKKPIWSVAALTVIAASLLGSVGAGSAWAARWGENYFPNHPVVTHEGKTVRFYDDLIRGKRVVINFVYASCPDLCSLSTARLARVRDFLGDAVGRDIFIYTITIDPENDTPEVLKKFADAFGAGDGWLFLTGKPEEIHEIRWKLGERSRSLSEHRSDMVIGNDPTGFWRRTSVMGSVATVTRTILDMVPGRRPLNRPTSTGNSRTREDYRIQDHPGEAMFLKACSFCHTIGRGDRFGPDLEGVTSRREHDWLVRYMRAPKLMRDRKDPIAVELDARYPGVTMPYLGLSEADAEDVIAYIKARTKLGAGTETAEADHDHQDHEHPSSSKSGMENNP